MKPTKPISKINLKVNPTHRYHNPTHNRHNLSCGKSNAKGDNSHVKTAGMSYRGKAENSKALKN